MRCSGLWCSLAGSSTFRDCAALYSPVCARLVRLPRCAGSACKLLHQLDCGYARASVVVRAPWTEVQLDRSGPLGITASDSKDGYSVWGGPPTMGPLDGTLVPCAAAGSLPFLPSECTHVLLSMREKLGARCGLGMGLWMLLTFAELVCQRYSRHRSGHQRDDGRELTDGFCLEILHEKP